MPRPRQYSSDLTQPVLAFRPVALAGGNLEDVAEVVGEETEHDELRMEPLGVLEQRVVFLLGRVAEVAGVEDRDPGLQLRLEDTGAGIPAASARRR